MKQQPPTQASGGTTSELSSDARHLGHTAANRIHSEVDARKDSAVGQAKSVSSAIERAAGELDQDAPDWLKTAFQQGARKIQNFADTIERKDSRELLREAQDFARNNTGTFLLACAAAGFAGARLLKAGGEQPQPGTQGYQGPPIGQSTRSRAGSIGARTSSQGQQPAGSATTRGEFA